MIRIKNGLFISRADSESQLCLQHNKPKRVVNFFLCICQHCPKVTNFVGFLAWDQYGEFQAGEGGPIKHQEKNEWFIRPSTDHHVLNVVAQWFNLTLAWKKGNMSRPVIVIWDNMIGQ